MQQKLSKRRRQCVPPFLWYHQREITELGRLTYIVFLKSVRQLLTKPLHKVFLLPGNTVDCWKQVFGGVQVSRTFYARGRPGSTIVDRRLSVLSRQIVLGNVNVQQARDVGFGHHRWQGARGIIAKSLTGKLERFGAHAVVLGTGGYGNVFYQHKCHGFQCYSCSKSVKKSGS